MVNVVLGQVVDNYYKVIPNTKTVNSNGEDITIFEKKPELVKEVKVREWKEICRFEGEVRYNQNSASLFSGYLNRVYISETEEVWIKQLKMRADLGEYHLCSDKILEETDVNKEIMEEAYEKLLGGYNYAMITSDDKMKDYCELHGLDMCKADCEKVFSLVYPNEIMKIVDGKISHFTKGEFTFKNGIDICNYGSLKVSDVLPLHQGYTAASSHAHVAI